MTTAHTPKPNAPDWTELAIVYQAPEVLKPYAKNPRKHSKAQINRIAASIGEFGFNAPILIDGSNQLIAGHARLAAAKQLGLPSVPTIQLAKLTPAQIKAYMIADNKLAELSSWDEPLLIEAFQELEALNFDLELTGFEMGEIDMLLGDAGKDASSKFDQIPDPALKGPPIAKPGEIWQLGRHRVMCGSALDADHMAELMGGRKAQMVFTDPPYNVRIQGNVSGLGSVVHSEFAMASGEMTKAQFIEFLNASFKQVSSHSKDGAIIYVCMDWRHMDEMGAAATGVFAELKNLCVWAKTNAGMGSFYRSAHEFVFVYKVGTAKHINNFGLGEHGRHRSNVWRYPGMSSLSTERQELLALHPTVKPVALIADAIKDCSHRNGIILDPFGGSGSTLIAAEICGRTAFLMEIDPIYVDLTIRRWQAATGERAACASIKTSNLKA